MSAWTRAWLLLLFALLVSRLASAQVCTAPSVPRIAFVAGGGSNPTEVVVADFDRNHWPDVAVVEPGGPSVSILFSGGASFALGPVFTLTSARDADAGDFNRDGWPDLVVSADADKRVLVIESDGFGGFLAPAAFPVGNGPAALAVGFLDGDGFLDVAVAEEGDGTVTVLLGDGLGALAIRDTFPLDVVFELVAADVDRDGVMDLLSTDAPNDRILVALGNGDGTFQPPVGSVTGGGPESLVVDDFDRDGFPDVVTANERSGDVAFLRGDGTPSFSILGSFPAGDSPHRLDKGDFDRNGFLDLAVGDDSTSAMHVLLGDGAGGFSAPSSTISDAPTFDVAVGDFNRDARDDIVATLPLANGVNHFENDFGRPCALPSFARLGRFYDVSTSPRAIAVAHLDSGFVPDFVVANDASSQVTRFLGQTTGDFFFPAVFATGTSPTSIDVAPIDADTHVDVITANPGSNDVSILWNSGSAMFPTRSDLSLPGTPVEVVAADVSADAKIDLVVALAAGNVVVGINDGAGNFPSFDPYAVGPSPRSVTVGDFDDDGLPDLAVAEASNQIVMLRNTGGGGFASAGSTPTLASPVSVKSAQLNGGANLDLVVASGTGAAGRVQTLLGNGNLTFTGGTDFVLGGGAGSPHGLALEDFDGDGVKDAAVVNVTNFRVRVLRSNGAGGFSGTFSVVTGEAPSAIAAADVDRDGLPDLLVSQPGASRVFVHYGDGAFSFGPGFFPSFTLGPNPDGRGVVSGDFDRDGDVDLAVADAGLDQVSRFSGNGAGGFGAAAAFSVAPADKPRWLSAGDFDNDGILDLVASAEGSAHLVFLQGNGAGGFAATKLTATGPAPFLNRAADFDFDGNLDVAVLSGSFVEVYAGNGAGNFFLQRSLSLSGVGSGLVVSDFDRDGFLDVAATQTSDHVLVVFWGSSVTAFDWPTNTQVPFGGGGPADFDAADFNEDGFADFVIPLSSTNRVQAVLSTGPRSYNVAPPAGTLLEPVSARAADFDRDGNADFVLALRGGHLVSFFLGNGLGSFLVQTDRSPALRRPNYLAVDDLDKDSLPDVALVPDTSSGIGVSGVAVLRNTNCRERVLDLAFDVSSCDLPSISFLDQPLVHVRDDGQNFVECSTELVTASIRPGTGAAGAVLLGSAALAPLPLSGIVNYTDLAVDRPGKRYQLQFTHPKARRVLSRTFSSGATIVATGPAALCQGDLAMYDSEPGFDIYEWRLDGSPVSMTQGVDLTALLTPGNRFVDVFGTVDGCVALDTVIVGVTENLSAVDASPVGPHAVCDTCTGPTIFATPSGGGAPSYQWGYRTTPVSGAITPLAGETADTYTVKGPDFGVGTFFLVVTVTPACGSPIVSSEIRIDVTSGGGLLPLVALTALSTGAQNLLEWSTPTTGPCAGVRILRNAAGFPFDPNDTSSNVHVGGVDFSCPGSGKDSFADVGLSDGTKYFYSAYVKDGGGMFSLVRKVAGRPFDNTTGNVKWSFSTGATAMAQASVRLRAGVASVYVVSNDSRVYALAGGSTGGQWLANAKPFVLGLPSQARNPVVPFSVGMGALTAPNGAVFVTSQDGNLSTLDADELDSVWTANVGESVMGAASGIFSGFAGARNLIFSGTKNTVSPDNLFRAFDVEDGTLKWSFDNSALQGGDGTAVGVILGGSAVDYAGLRAFFGSRNGGASSTVWALDVSGASPLLLWSRDIGHVDTSPVLMRGLPRRLVVASNPGEVHLLDADDNGNSLWLAPYPTGDGNVKGFVFPHFHDGKQYFMFSTVNQLTSILDNGPATNPTLRWQISTIPFPSSPVFLPGTTTALVGGADGKLYQLNGVDTASPSFVFVVLDPSGTGVGTPSFDVINRLVYAGAEDGVVYAVAYPIP